MHHFTYAKRKSLKCCPWYTDQTYSFARKLSGIPKTWKTELVTEQVLVIGFCTYPVFFFILIAAFRLLIKTAILMPEAKEGEVTIVEVESVGHNKTKVLRMLMLPNNQLHCTMYQGCTHATFTFIQCTVFYSYTITGEGSLGRHERRERSAEVRGCPPPILACYHKNCSSKALRLGADHIIT